MSADDYDGATGAKKSRERSDLDGLLQCQDREFVESAYRLILRRDADSEGLKFYLSRVRNGVSKLRILNEISSSDEGRRIGAELKGLRRALKSQELSSVPVLGRLFKHFLGSEGDSSTEVRLRVMEHQPYILRDALSALIQRQNVVERLLGNPKELQFAALQTLSDSNHRQLVSDKGLDNLRNSVPVALRMLARDLAEVRSHHERLAATQTQLAELSMRSEQRLNEAGPKLESLSRDVSPLLGKSAFRDPSTAANSGLSFSVVINTDGRRSLLKRTLDCLQYLDYKNFEVCIVYGPTDDGTKEYLASYGHNIKLAACPVRNLSRSRNIGIAMADGDVVAFIDDDAVPEREWLTDLAKSYADPSVGAAGGFVYDNTGVAFQAKYVTTNRRGYADGHWSEPASYLNFPYSLDYPHLLGTNCSFRTSVLLEIGGFDEEYEYFLDETDVCCRVNDAGHRIDQRPDAFVHHKFAPSEMRDERRTVRNWYPLIKNRVYFGMRNGRYHHSFREVMGAGLEDAAGWEKYIRGKVAEGRHTEEDLTRFLAQADAAIEDGYKHALQPLRKLLTAETLAAFASPFNPFELRLPPAERRVICFVTQDYPPNQNGGIARYFAQLARSLAEIGHHVHVLTKAREAGSVDFEDKVWVHRLPIRHFEAPSRSPIHPLIVPPHIWDYTQTMLEEVKSIHRLRPVDVVYCPLWDCEPLAFTIDKTFPVICALQTTLKFWLESQPTKAADKEWMRLFGNPIIAMEEFIIARATLLHGISSAIVNDIQRAYELTIPAERVAVSPLGLEDWAVQAAATRVQKPEGCVRLLFVGRLESRKGIDILLEVAPSILKQFPDAVLDIVGDDTIPRSDGMTYKDEFLKSKVPDEILSRIIFHGRAEEKELRGFYKYCDIFVAPSRYESFGLVFLEAMMFGKPVIACNSGGAPEVVTHGITGLLVKPGDTKSLAQALQTLISDGDRRTAMGAAARADYELRFTEDVMRDALIDMINRLVMSDEAA
jgi:glycogen(starch) synthase